MLTSPSFQPSTRMSLATTRTLSRRQMVRDANDQHLSAQRGSLAPKRRRSSLGKFKLQTAGSGDLSGAGDLLDAVKMMPSKATSTISTLDRLTTGRRASNINSAALAEALGGDAASDDSTAVEQIPGTKMTTHEV